MNSQIERATHQASLSRHQTEAAIVTINRRGDDWAKCFGLKLSGGAESCWATTRAMARVALGSGPPLIVVATMYLDLS